MGKAKSLRPRVRSYFQASADTRSTIAQLPERVQDIEVIVTDTEVEALHLEQNLVKRHRPPFNVRLRDDKSFPYIAVTVEDDYPRVMFTRERHRRGVVYFGPYANAKKVRETLDVLNRVFPYRPCEGPKPGRHSGIPCLDYHIERCLAPCVGYISKEDYRAIIDSVIEFLSGDTKPIQRELERKMKDAAEGERFEEAARYRNRLFAVRHLVERQAADKRSVGTVDVIGIASDGERAAVQVFPLRDGKLIDRYAFHLENVAGQDTATLLEAFAIEYYGSAPSMPPQIVVPPDSGDTSALAEFLSERRGSRVEVRAPARREAAAAGARDPERAARARVGGTAGRAQAGAAGRGARGAARGAQPGEPAAADRVLRRLEHPGRVGGRLDGRLPGRDAEEGALPEVRRAQPRRPGRLRRAGGGDRAPVRPAPGCDLGGVRRVVRDHAEPRRDRRRQGSARGRAGGDAGLRPAAGGRDLAREAGRGGLRPGAAGSDRARPQLARTPPAAASAGRGAPVRARLPPPAAPGQGTGVDLRHPPGRGTGAAPCAAGHFGSAERFLAASQEELEGVPGIPARTARAIYAQLHKAGRA